MWLPLHKTKGLIDGPVGLSPTSQKFYQKCPPAGPALLSPPPDPPTLEATEAGMPYFSLKFALGSPLDNSCATLVFDGYGTTL